MIVEQQDSPYNIPEAEAYPKKHITIQNNTDKTMAIGQLRSSWDSVNFVLEAYERHDKNVKWLATLYPFDKIELSFREPEKIEQ